MIDTELDTTPFLSIKDCATKSGLSQKYLRAGCKNNTIPFIKYGIKYMINYNLLIEQLNRESVGVK